MNTQQWYRSFVVLAAVAVAGMAGAQQASTRRAPTPRADRERILIRIDSLMYEFDHAPLSAEESESLRVEMAHAMQALEPTMAMSYSDDMSPQGYLGATFDGPSVELPRPNERVIRFLDYPRVSMVEPGSPAERGGVAQGDTLIALNGLDVKDRDISLTRILVPSKRIIVRVHRDGRARDLRVTVDTSPEYMVRRMVPMPSMPAIAFAPGVIAPATPAPPVAMTYAMPRVARVAPTPPVMAMTDIDMWTDAEGVAGARLVAVTEGLGRALGVTSGVLVLRASPGTPAFESGLREGDVIVRAEGKSVASIRDVRRVAANADREKGVALVVLREKRERPVTLRW